MEDVEKVLGLVGKLADPKTCKREVARIERVFKRENPYLFVAFRRAMVPSRHGTPDTEENWRQRVRYVGLVVYDTLYQKKIR